jgi:hypothetical protein
VRADEQLASFPQLETNLSSARSLTTLRGEFGCPFNSNDAAPQGESFISIRDGRRRCVGAAKNSNGNRQLDSISVAVTVYVIVTLSPALILPLSTLEQELVRFGAAK